MQHLVGSRLAADIDLVAQLLILLGLWGGAYLARTRRFRAHGVVQTTLVLSNLVFIFLIMILSFNTYVIAGQTTTGPVARIMLLHGAMGLIAELTALYLVVRMRTKLLTPRLRVRNIKRLMRAVLLLWTAVVLIGATLYRERYLVTPAAAASAPLSQLRQSGADVYVHAVELQDAVQRHNLATAKRHAEHLVNLIEDRNGPHYGDVDGNGVIEDPGDGTGLMPELQAVTRATSDHTVTSDTGVFNSGDMSRGDTFAYTFTTPGQFPYYCRYHGDKGGIGMSGIVIVSAPASG